jgi:hypothetical protein
LGCSRGGYCNAGVFGNSGIFGTERGYTLINLLLTAALALPLLSFPVPAEMPVEIGLLSQYEKQPTIDTLFYRQYVSEQIPQELPDNAVLMAVADCDMIGQQGLVSVNGDEWEPMWVYDCAGSAHARDWLNDNGFIGEMDYFTALRHDAVCRCPVDGRVMWFD